MDTSTPPKTSQKLVGQRIKRVEDPRLLTGYGSYVDDKAPPRGVHVAFLRSDRSHALIASIDVASAREMPGVISIVTAQDLEGQIRPAIATSRMKHYHPTPMYALARGKVRYVGEPVVAVVAESRYLAEDAVEAVFVEYEDLPVVADPEVAAESTTALLHEEAGTNIVVARAFRRGEPEQVLAAAPVRVAGRFRFRRKTPVAIEPRTYLAEYDRGQQYLTLYSSTQVPGIVHDVLVDVLDIPGNRLRVVAPDVGGGFGGKASVYPEEMLVSWLARKLGRPVKWTADRQEDLLSTSHGFDERIDAELALDADGHLLALRADVLGDVGAYSIFPWTAGLEPVQVISFMPGPYRLEHYDGRTRGVVTSKSPTGPYRGVGRPVSTFVMERLMDMAARELKLDPVELRRRNLITKDEFPYKTAPGIVWDRSGFVEGLEAACERIGYAGLRAQQAQARQAGRLVGIGVSTYAELSGIGSRISASPGMPINTGTETVTIRIDATGSITAAFGVSSMGQGLETTLAQVVADELGARFEDIRIVVGDSSTVPHGTGAYASRTAVLGGGAATLAARALRARIKRLASHLLQTEADAIEVTGGAISGGGRSINFKELANACYTEIGRIPMEAREDLVETKIYDPFFGTTSSATHVAQVEVDRDTCAIHVQRYVVAEDCGRLINPLIVDGQVRGAVIQGIGAALMEEVVYDENGQMQTASLVDYVIPTAPEAPNVGVVHLEMEAQGTLGGFRGMGEGGTIGAPAAISNAVADALAPLGVEIFELPITPERLFRLLQPHLGSNA